MSDLPWDVYLVWRVLPALLGWTLFCGAFSCAGGFFIGNG